MGKRGPKPRGLVHLSVRVPTEHKLLLEVMAVERDTDVTSIVSKLISAEIDARDASRKAEQWVLDLIKSDSAG